MHIQYCKTLFQQRPGHHMPLKQESSGYNKKARTIAQQQHYIQDRRGCNTHTTPHISTIECSAIYTAIFTVMTTTRITGEPLDLWQPCAARPFATSNGGQETIIYNLGKVPHIHIMYLSPLYLIKYSITTALTSGIALQQPTANQRVPIVYYIQQVAKSATA